MCEREGERERTTDTNADTDTDKYTHNHVDQLRYGVATIGRLLKIVVSFAEYRLFYRSLLKKRPIILRSLLVATTP